MATHTFKPHVARLYTDAMGSAVILPDITSLGLNLNPELMAEMVADSATPKHVAMVARKLMGNVECFSIASAIDAIGLTGLTINAATNSGVEFYLQKFDKNGFAASSNHRSFTFKKGVVVPKTISVQHRQDAKLTFDVVPIYDGTNNAVVIADNASLPSITIAAARWTLGPIIIGGDTLTEYTGLEIDFGNTVETGSSESDQDETHVAVRTHEPKITITGIDPLWFSGTVVGLGGSVVAQSTDAIYLRKRAQDAVGFVADATAEHIKFTPCGLAAVNQAFRAQAQRIGETTIEVKLAIDASGNAALAVDTTSALP
jgi:hypothetical protein